VSEENSSPIVQPEQHALVIPAFKDKKAASLVLNRTREGEKRLPDSQNVSPVTYSELEFTFGEAYREIRNNMATVTSHLLNAQKVLEQEKATVLLDLYPEFMQGRPKSQDNAQTRDAFLIRNKEYVEALDHVNKLKAFEAYLDGKIKVFERTCAAMKKKMDLIIRSGLSSHQLYGK